MSNNQRNTNKTPTSNTSDLEALRRYIQTLEDKNAQLENANRCLSHQLHHVT